MISQHFSHALLVTRKPLSPVHTQGEGTDTRKQEAGTGKLLEAVWHRDGDRSRVSAKLKEAEAYTIWRMLFKKKKEKLQIQNLT